jgi:hypothetical protein
MAEKITIKAHENHVMHRIALLKRYRVERGEVKTANGYMIPKTLHQDIEQLMKWWNLEYRQARVLRPFHRDPAQPIWEKARAEIRRDLEGADPDAVYPRNEWFWNDAILKLAIYLESQKNPPSDTDLLIDSFKETIEERIDDAESLIEGVGDAASTVVDVASRAAGAVTEAGGRVWSGLKLAAIIGGSLVGAAIVVPPIIRAFRD